ncbi:MAG: SPOR domain-containing protein [Alphaproteobacteria bacterium]|nr:SPOR domain-containing protein [Alphaproteobacteria bacterium]
MNQRYSTQRFRDLDEDYQPHTISFDDDADLPPPTMSRFEQPGFIGGLMRRPIMTMMLLATLGLTAGALVMKFYPSATGPQGALPVIKADTTPFRQSPDSPGGMNIPGSDSALFDVVDGQSATQPADAAAAATQTTATQTPADGDSLESYTAQAQSEIGESMPTSAPAADAGAAAQATAQASQPDLLVPEQRSETTAEIAENTATTASTLPDTLAAAPASVTTQTAPSAPSQAALQPAPESAPPGPASTQTMAAANSTASPAPAESAAPAQQQALLEQVPPSPEAANAVEPAAGAAKPSAFSIMPGDYYIQLSSVTSETGAQKEWTKLRKDYGPILVEAPHRIKRVDLGERGIYFRVQAGPMNRESAKRLCDAIKTQKPSGCLIVQ